MNLFVEVEAQNMLENLQFLDSCKDFLPTAPVISDLFRLMNPNSTRRAKILEKIKTTHIQKINK